ncbi:MAG: hypothetical protein PWQ17_2424 [Anaerophaga sp.]|nr:hypothetical protein [Anaerophaga sp.]
MFGRSVLILLLFYVSGFSAFGQNYQKLLTEWQGYLNADDNEKDYTEVSFRRSIEGFLESGGTYPDSVSLLPGWKRKTSHNRRFSIFATIVPFETKPYRLLYCLQDHHAGRALTFSREISSRFKDEWSLLLQEKQFDKDTVVYLDISFGKEKLLNIPDIETAVNVAILSRTRGEEAIFTISAEIQQRIAFLMGIPELFMNNFSGFSGLSTLLLPEEGLKIVTWNVEERMGDHHFYGVIATYQEDENIKVFQLNDKFRKTGQPEFSVLTYPDWYGAVYYDVIPVVHDKKTYYTLLGYNGNDAFSRMRIVDVLYFSEEGTPCFGAPLFNVNDGLKKRLIFEYSNRAEMMLRYDKREKMIVMDHLAPMEPVFEGDRSYYGPDFSYDVLDYQEGKWLLVEDVELRNRD